MTTFQPQPDPMIPVSLGIIDRPRLVEKLSAVLDHKLTIISAPPGYGKTTLAAQFLRQVDCPVAWHSIEERERDIPNLYAKCLASLEPIAPGILNLASAYNYAPGEFAALVTNHLRTVPAKHMIYLLDDIHHLVGSPAAETWLRVLVELLPPNCHLILLSRFLPDLPLVEVIARREILALGQDDLRLTPDEIAALGQTVLGTELPSETVGELALRLEGWPAGTVIAMRPLPQDIERTLLQGGQGPEALFDALASSMLNNQPPGIRNFLLASSTLKRMTPELCTNVLTLPDGLARFEEVQSRNLFTVRTSGGIVYHSLFRNFLQRELKTTNAGLFVDLHTQAAQWFEENDVTDDAFDHYVAAGRLEDAARLANYVAHSYFGQGKVETLLEWGALLSGLQAPRLLYIGSVILTDRYEYAGAEQNLDASEQGFLRSEDEAGLCDVLFQRAMIELQQGHYHEAINLAASLLPRLSSGLINLRGRALRTLGLAYLRLGELETALNFMNEALPIYRTDGDVYALSLLLQDFAAAYAQVGRIEEARAYLQEVVALTRSLGSQGALAMALNNLGYYYHRSSDYAQALTTFQEGLSVANRVRDKRAESYILSSTADLHRDMRNYPEALRLYNKVLELLGEGEPPLRSITLIGLSVLQRWCLNFREAAMLAEEANALAERYKLSVEAAVAKAAIWAARANTGEVWPAMSMLSEVARDLERRGAKFELVTIMSQCAHVAQLCLDETRAKEYLQKAFQMATEVACIQPLAAEISHLALLEKIVRADPQRYDLLLRELKRLYEIHHKDMPLSANSKSLNASLTYSLRIRTFGREIIERDGEPISPSEWRGSNARELFLQLLFLGPTTKEQFNLAFWPDKSSKSVRSNFHTTLHRARQALGENVILFADGLYSINPGIDIWCDAHKMELFVKRARVLPSRDARTEDLWQKAALLYEGDFLPSLDAEWVTERRQVYHELHIETLVGLGECARARGDLRRAIQSFKEALVQDPYREEIHRSVMTCYAELGERKQLLDYIRQLQQRLRTELEVELSEETLNLADTLLN